MNVLSTYRLFDFIKYISSYTCNKTHLRIKHIHLVPLNIAHNHRPFLLPLNLLGTPSPTMVTKCTADPCTTQEVEVLNPSSQLKTRVLLTLSQKLRN